jgi:CheY-like chemotaxis protein
MKILFLDDDPIRTAKFMEKTVGHEVLTAETAQDAIALLDTHLDFDIASLDHDLGGEVFCESNEVSGYAVAQAIDEMPVEDQPLCIIVHSFNPAGAERMANKIPAAARIPFGSEHYWRAFEHFGLAR